MDYIIIALWGLIAGGLLWGGGNRDIQSQQIVQPKQDVEISEFIERPDQQVSKPKVILSSDLNEVQSSVPQTRNHEDIAIVESPFDATSNIVDVEPVARPSVTETTSVPVVKEKNGQAISFNKTKKKEHSSKKKSTQKAIKFNKNGDSTANVVERQSGQPSSETASVEEVVRDTVYVYAESNQMSDIVPSEEYAAVSASSAIVEESVKSEPKPLVAETNTSSNKQANIRLPKGLTIEQLLCDANGKPKIHVMKRGETLTQIAQKYYADACFWPYIVEVNKNKIKSPDKLQADMRLYLPDPKFYGINGNSPASVNKAKALGNKYK